MMIFAMALIVISLVMNAVDIIDDLLFNPVFVQLILIGTFLTLCIAIIAYVGSLTNDALKMHR